jgi:hypothetical protein
LSEQRGREHQERNENAHEFDYWSTDARALVLSFARHFQLQAAMNPKHLDILVVLKF